MKSSSKGFTLIELLSAAAIIAFCLSGLLATYYHTLFLSDLLRDFTLATNAIQAKIEEIKNTSFDSLSALNGNTFNLVDYGFASSKAKGRIEVTPESSDLKRVRIVISFKSRGRLIGEDTNLNGSLDSGEDANINGLLDSPVELVILIVQ